MQITATIKRILETNTVSETFKFRDVHVTTEEQYSQVLNIQFVQEKTAALDGFKPGDKVKIEINLRGRETEKEGKTLVFNTLQGWKIEKTV